ncbi:MAG: Uncharacterized protein CEO21_351 [Microgenomates group bacterium Gr01-1014_80]|nr:MAG: Uncharacterized protein CEO21_351 [Microgenomates group bacterium Gr01-1014_80]
MEVGGGIILDFVKIAILILLFFYAIFALLIVRQVDLMSKTLITPVSALVKAISIIHAGFAVGFLVLAFGLL